MATCGYPSFATEAKATQGRGGVYYFGFYWWRPPLTVRSAPGVGPA